MTGILIDTSLLISFFKNQLDERPKNALNRQIVSLSIISWFEFEKWLLKVQHAPEREFLMQRLENTFETLEVDPEICRRAAQYAHSDGLSTADALIYATAQANGLKLATSDSDLKGKPGVLFCPSKK